MPATFDRPGGFFNSRELQVILAKHRGKAVPDRTLRFWRNELKIRPIDGCLYDRDDLHLLVRLVRWLGRGGTIQGFKAILIAEYETQQTLETEQTISV
jgi:DNA-binding transcriptional MerR regulator